MLSVHTPADVTVQRLLQADPHLRDAHIFYAIAHLVERSEIPHLERIVAALVQQMRINRPEHRNPSALDNIFPPNGSFHVNTVTARLEPAIYQLICRAIGRVPNLSTALERVEPLWTFSLSTAPCPIEHVTCR